MDGVCFAVGIILAAAVPRGIDGDPFVLRVQAALFVVLGGFDSPEAVRVEGSWRLSKPADILRRQLRSQSNKTKKKKKKLNTQIWTFSFIDKYYSK